MEKTELLGLGVPELELFLSGIGQPAYRGRQIYKWIYQKHTASFAEMSDLPRELRANLEAGALVSIPRLLKHRISRDGTHKLLLELKDHRQLECVIIPQGEAVEGKYTLCLSTQVGCPLACEFCATGRAGFERQLSSGEIAGQLLRARRELDQGSERISNVVYMGMGEPMLNYDQVIKSIYILNEPRGINIGQRHITISTAGEVKGIERLAREELQITLAISLHACDDQLRSRLMPINRKYPLARLIKAVQFFISRTGRRVTFEYILLAGINDRREDASNMVKLLRPLLANINLIPYNEVDGLLFRKPAPEKMRRFAGWLEQEGLTVTIRQEKGADIEAACGQLKCGR